MSGTNSLGYRMKRYEQVTDICLTRRMPVILRVDGEHFKSFTRGLKKPFDDIFRTTMAETMLELCKSIEGAVLGYVQSDEITIVLVDYKTLTTDAWFDYRLQKLCSITASRASRFFNKIFIEQTEKSSDDTKIYRKKFNTADFDCRAFNVPREDVCNQLIWRQRDAVRNSIHSVARTQFTTKELHGLKNNQVQDKLFTEKGINWNNFCAYYKRGCTCLRDENGKWYIDYEAPTFTQDRDYIERLLKEEEQ